QLRITSERRLATSSAVGSSASWLAILSDRRPKSKSQRPSSAMNSGSEYRAAMVMCATTSRTRQSSQSEAVSHCPSVAEPSRSARAANSVATARDRSMSSMSATHQSQGGDYHQLRRTGCAEFIGPHWPRAVNEESVVTGAEIVYPLRVTVAAGSLLRLDHAAALRAELAGHVHGMIFAGGPVLLVELNVRQSLRFCGRKYPRQIEDRRG